MNGPRYEESLYNHLIQVTKGKMNEGDRTVIARPCRAMVEEMPILKMLGTMQPIDVATAPPRHTPLLDRKDIP